MIVAGIDWSISCPSICIYGPDSYEFYSFSKAKKYVGKYSVFNLKEVAEFKNNQDRFDDLTEWAMQIIRSSKVEVVFIEDYAFAGNGRITDIAECVGVLKHKLYKNGISCFAFSPSEIKKFATGKGNAKKPDMLEAFEKTTGVDFYQELGMEKNLQNIPSPIQDMVDSFWVASYGKTQIVS